MMSLPQRRLGRGTLLVVLLLGAGLIAVIAIYGGGFAYLRDHQSFSDRRVTFTWRDTKLETALKQLLPGREIRFADDVIIDEYRRIWILHIDDMEERETVRWLSGYCRLRIRNNGSFIEVSRHSWLSQSYVDVHWWLRHHLGFSPWGHGPANPGPP